VGPAELGVTMDQKILTSKIGYKVLDSRQAGHVGGTTLWTFLGVRNWVVKPGFSYQWDPIVGNDPPITADYYLEDKWWDPLVGLGAHFEVTQVVKFLVRGNIGGLGVGDGSKLTWDLGAYATFQPWRPAAVHAGYQGLYYNRTTGAGVDETTTKYMMTGLFMGMSFFN